MDAFPSLQQINPVYIQWFFIAWSVLIIIIELPLAMNRVRPNFFYGFRIRKTLSNERIWYLANEYAAKRAILTAIITIITAVVLRLFTVSTVTYISICAIVLLGGLALTIIRTYVYIDQMP